jgi:hypothetical protein
MAFAVNDFRDLLQLLDEHPEWQAELRRKILDDEFLRLPEYVRQNSADIRELQIAVTLAAAQEEMSNLLRRNIIRTDKALGGLLEIRYRRHADGYFGHRLRKARAVAADSLALFEQADDDQRISRAEAIAVRNLDIIVQGVQGYGDEREDALLAVEVSNVVDSKDIEGAANRAAILRRVGYANTVAIVVGSYISDPHRAYATELGVDVQIEEDQDYRPLAS